MRIALEGLPSGSAGQPRDSGPCGDKRTTADPLKRKRNTKRGMKSNLKTEERKTKRSFKRRMARRMHRLSGEPKKNKIQKKS